MTITCRSTVCLLVGCASLLLVAGIAGCSTWKQRRGEPAEHHVQVLPGSQLPEVINSRIHGRCVTCPPGTYHATLWRPLEPPQMQVPSCMTCTDSSCQVPVQSGQQPGPLGPEEIPLPTGTPLEPALAPPDAFEPPGLPDVSDQPLPRDGVARADSPAATSEQPVASAAEQVEAAGPALHLDVEPTEPALLHSDVELVELILAEDIEPWSGRIVPESVPGE